MHYATGFVSDIHIGSLVTKAHQIHAFLTDNTFDRLYLVGDIFDFWKSFHVSRESKMVVMRLLKLSDEIPVVFIPGNHDAWFRDFDGDHLEGISIAKQAVHVGKDGRKWLVMHGDTFDPAPFIKDGFLSRIGGWVYDASIMLVNAKDRARATLGVRKGDGNPLNITNYLRDLQKFELAACRAAARAGCCGIVCGHTHTHALKVVNVDGANVNYVNTGDWVISCTAAVENMDGTISIYTHGKQP